MAHFLRSSSRGLSRECQAMAGRSEIGCRHGSTSWNTWGGEVGQNDTYCDLHFDVSISVHVYIYIERERVRHICIYIYM